MSIRNQKAAVTTGASQGMGAAFVAAYRKLGYAVVASAAPSLGRGTPMSSLFAATSRIKSLQIVSSTRAWTSSDGSTR